jgi:hypothetical protein
VSYGDSIRVRRDNYDNFGLPSTILHETYSERGLEYSRKLIAYGQILNAVIKNKFDELNRLIESYTRLHGQFEQDACRVYKIEYYDQD